jgi:hypothetical protein
MQYLVFSHSVCCHTWHCQKSIKLCNADQAKQVYQYKNTKEKLYKNNAAIWYNKTYRARQLTPTYANIKIKGTNPRCQKTKDAAIRFRINQELKFQYVRVLATYGSIQSVRKPDTAYIQCPPEDERCDARNM